MKKLFFPFAIAVLALSGCMKEATSESKKVQIVDPNPPAPDPDVVTFFAQIPSKYTKSEFVLDTKKVTWTKDDAVFITDGEKEAIYTSFYGKRDTTRLFHFQGDTLAIGEGVRYRAIFPAEGGLVGGLPTVQTYYGRDRVIDLPMVAEFTQGKIADGGIPVDTLNFKYLCGVLQINAICSSEVYADLGNAAPIMKEIVIKANEPLSGKGEITFGNEPSIVLEGKDSLVLDCGGMLRVGTSAVPAFVSLPEGTYTNVKFKFNTTDKKSFVGELDAPLTIYRGGTATCDVTFGYELVPQDITDGETANCYIVEAPGLYNIKPVKGNSSESVGKVAGVKVLWEMTLDNASSKTAAIGCVISKAVWNEELGCIQIKIANYPTNGGNALVAATDASGNILWSWHIWLPITSTKYYVSVPYSTDGSLAVLNLSMGQGGNSMTWSGSSSSALSSPLLYQWGRKDPLPGQIRNSSEYASFAGELISGGVGYEIEVVDNAVTIEESIKHPVTFYHDDATGDWLSDPNDNLWSENKTIYDPCPAGYRVMSPDVILKGDLLLADWDATANTGHCLNSRGVHFFSQSKNENSSAKPWTLFTNTGRRDSDKGTLTRAGSAYMWTNQPIEGKAGYFLLGATAPKETTAANRAAAYGVRCQTIIAK